MSLVFAFNAIVVGFVVSSLIIIIIIIVVVVVVQMIAFKGNFFHAIITV